jgi:branched-chain amino acid transport system ATP-binding protein
MVRPAYDHDGAVVSLLEVRDLVAFYGDFQALFGVDIAIDEGECVALIGSNGAGKSTLLRTIAGLMKSRPEAVCFDGRPIGGIPAPVIARQGIALVPEGRRLFASLNVEENLRMGAFSGRRGHWTLERVYQVFPVLREKRAAPSHTLSGGQQQMAAIGRALMANPRLLMCDEISLGLAPTVAKDVYAALRQVRAQGLATIIVEQDIELARTMSDRAYCFTRGRVSLVGRSAELTRGQISSAYFGVSVGEPR